MTPPVPVPGQFRRGTVLRAAGLILVGSAGIQISSALSATLFAAHGPFAVSSLRMIIAALVLLVVFRPSLRGRDRTEWTGIVVYGAAMAAMNLCLYAAIDRIPLGIAVTLDFLGPCAVALLASHRIREGLCAVLSLAGVALMSIGPWGYFDALGYLAGLGAAAAFGLYTVCAHRVGTQSEGLGGLALSVTAAALLSLPFGVGRIAQVPPADWGLLALSALVGVVVPYSVDTIAGRITSPRIIGTLFAIDPAMGTLVGFLMLGQQITPLSLLGVLVVAAGGALLVWSSGGAAADQSDAGGAEDADSAASRRVASRSTSSRLQKAKRSQEP